MTASTTALSYTVSMRQRIASRELRGALVLGFELLMIVAANRVAFALRFDSQEPAWAMAAWTHMLPWLLAARLATFGTFGLHKRIWRYTSIYDLASIVEAVLLSSAVFALITLTPAGPAVYPRSIFVIDGVLLTVALSAARIGRRLSAECVSRARARDSRTVRDGKRLLVVGAGDAGAALVHQIRSKGDEEYRPIGFVDDDPTKRGLVIHGVPVLGGRDVLPQILATHRPDEILVAVRDAEPGLLRAVVDALGTDNTPIKVLPQLRDVIDRHVDFQRAQPLKFEDLLSRAPVGLDPAPLRRLIGGRRVLVTGAGGSIGSELCRQIARMSPASLVMLDRYENGLHAVGLELARGKGRCPVHPVIADVTDASRLDAVFASYRPEIVFHAAAHKHVPLMEDNPCEAIKNNVTGTRLLAAAAERHGTDRVILISTDKAVNPVNAMGASKRLAEMVLQTRGASRGRTTFASVRFGNVLGSNGSVIPLFLAQIREGGPVTVTHPEVRRFFMLIPEAVQLVLHAATAAEDGAVFVLEMGEQVKLLDIARHLIRLSGFIPDRDIKIEFIGLRPGEKLEEQLVGVGETVCRSRIDKILRIADTHQPDAGLLARIAAIERCAQVNDAAAVRALIADLLPSHPAADSTVFAPVADEAISSVDTAATRRPNCRQCGIGHLRRVHARSLVERMTRAVADKRLFSCDECGWRGWVLPLDVAVGTPDIRAHAPDLYQLDPEVATIPADSDRGSPLVLLN